VEQGPDRRLQVSARGPRRLLAAAHPAREDRPESAAHPCPGGGNRITTKLTLAELESSTERELGTSEWETIDQRQIDLFADATHDHQWIHVDPELAAQGPFGTTVAHGYLSLSMLPYFVSQVLNVTDVKMGINYGTEKIRFTAPVPVGSQVRLKATLRGSERRGEGVLYRLGVEVEIRDAEKPALVGEVLYLVF
jgi:acyl dehydratase